VGLEYLDDFAIVYFALLTFRRYDRDGEAALASDLDARGVDAI
jgi:hypothetical protein